MSWTERIVAISVTIILMVVIVLIVLVPTKPEITVQPHKPTREYIRKYPVAEEKGQYIYVLVREYKLEVEFVDDTTYGGIDKEGQ